MPQRSANYPELNMMDIQIYSDNIDLIIERINRVNNLYANGYQIHTPQLGPYGWTIYDEPYESLRIEGVSIPTLCKLHILGYHVQCYLSSTKNKLGDERNWIVSASVSTIPGNTYDWFQSRFNEIICELEQANV